MHEQQPPPDFPLPYLPEQQPPRKARLRYKHLIWIFAAVAIVLISAVAAYLWVNKSKEGSSGPTTRSVTYYYRDGKTILWQGTRLAETDSPTFVHAVADELLRRYGEKKMQENGEWKIVTTLDESLQEAAKQQVQAQREQMSRQGAEDAALIAQDVTTGQIVSWVGSFEDKVFASGEDRLSTRTQPGSLMLPLVYAAYMDGNTDLGASNTVEDTQRPLPGYPCTNMALLHGNCLVNYDRKYLGQMTLRQALGGLRLVPAVQAMVSAVPNDSSPGNVASINKTIAAIEALMGNSSGYRCFEPGTDVASLTSGTERQYETQCFAAAAIGDGAYAKPSDVINAFGTLSNNGKQLLQAYYLRIEQNGKVVDEWKAVAGKQAVKANAANAINDILSDPSSSYIAKKDYFNVGNKRVGTMSGFTSEAVTVGAVQYTAKYAVGFWGFSGTRPITGFAETFTLPATYGWLNAVISQ
jgi:membrane peptidoglycan carboxypeptidase